MQTLQDKVNDFVELLFNYDCSLWTFAENSQMSPSDIRGYLDGRCTTHDDIVSFVSEYI